MEYLAHLIKNTVFVLVAMRIVIVFIILYAGYRFLLNSSWFKKIRW